MTSIDRLTAWYRSQCDGDWEHSYGVNIGTLDNPGWLVKIDLVGTKLEGRSFSRKTHGDSERGESWIDCKVEGKQFVGAGGIGNLAELLEIFLTWSEGQ